MLFIFCLFWNCFVSVREVKQIYVFGVLWSEKCILLFNGLSVKQFVVFFNYENLI